MVGSCLYSTTCPAMGRCPSQQYQVQIASCWAVKSKIADGNTQDKIITITQLWISLWSSHCATTSKALQLGQITHHSSPLVDYTASLPIKSQSSVGRLPGEFQFDSLKSCGWGIWCLQQEGLIFVFFMATKDNDYSLLCFGSLLEFPKQQLEGRFPLEPKLISDANFNAFIFYHLCCEWRKLFMAWRKTWGDNRKLLIARKRDKVLWIVVFLKWHGLCLLELSAAACTRPM